MKASDNGHKDIAIALAEKGADLNMKSNVSDCCLCVYGDDDDDDDDDAGVSGSSRPTSTTRCASNLSRSTMHM